MRETIEINTPFIRLDDALKFVGAVMTGGQAKWVIQNGGVSVNGEVCTMRGKKLYGGELILVHDSKREIVICKSTN